MPAKKKTTVPVKLEHWFNDLQSVTRLRELLDDLALQQAIAILEESAGPTVTSLDGDPHVNSQKLAWYAGYRDAFNDLEKLTHRPSNTKNNQTNEWTHL